MGRIAIAERPASADRAAGRRLSRPTGEAIDRGATAAWLRRDQLRVAVVGYGSIGRRHAENLERLGVEGPLVVRRAKGANPAFAPPPCARVVHRDADAIDAGLHAAIICNPTSLHVATAERYLTAGVPVLIEKPLCAMGHERAATRLAALAAEQGLAAGMAYCLRYHPAYRLAHAVLASGRLGRPLTAEAWFESYLPDWHPWEDYRQSYAARAELGGGVLPTLDHEIDFLDWCLGEPRKVGGRLTSDPALAIDVPGTAHLELAYADGSRADVRLSFACPQRSRGFRFVGPGGTLRFDWADGLLELASPEAASETLWSAATPSGPYDLNHMYRELLSDFLLAIQRRTAAPVPLSAALAASEVGRKVSR